MQERGFAAGRLLDLLCRVVADRRVDGTLSGRVGLKPAMGKPVRISHQSMINFRPPIADGINVCNMAICMEKTMSYVFFCNWRRVHNEYTIIATKPRLSGLMTRTLVTRCVREAPYAHAIQRLLRGDAQVMTNDITRRLRGPCGERSCESDDRFSCPPTLGGYNSFRSAMRMLVLCKVRVYKRLANGSKAHLSGSIVLMPNESRRAGRATVFSCLESVPLLYQFVRRTRTSADAVDMRVAVIAVDDASPRPIDPRVDKSAFPTSICVFCDAIRMADQAQRATSDSRRCAPIGWSSSMPTPCRLPIGSPRSRWSSTTFRRRRRSGRQSGRSRQSTTPFAHATEIDGIRPDSTAGRNIVYAPRYC